MSLVLAGCAVQATPQPGDALDRSKVTLGADPPADIDFMPFRVGIEYLPANATPSAESDTLVPTILAATHEAQRQLGRSRVEAETISVTALRAPRPASRRRPAAEPSSDRLRVYDDEELAAIEDPAERYTMSFINDLIGEDRRRMQRELRTPIFTNRLRYSTSPALQLPLEEQEIEQEATFLNGVARGLLRRPLRNLLKAITRIDDLELAFKEFKRDNLPLTTAYNKRTGRRTGWGRMSMRLRLSNGSDPLELAYYNWGMRFASSKERGRIQYRFRFSDQIHGNVRYRFHYETHDAGIQADLNYNIDERTSATLLLGDRMDFLAGPTAYSFLHSPMDGSPGVLFFVEHLF